MKKKNKLLILGSLSIISPVLLSLSVSTTISNNEHNSIVNKAVMYKEGTTPSNPTDPKPVTPPKPKPVNAVDFGDFDKAFDESLKQELLKIKENFKLMVDARLDELGKDNDFPTPEKFEQILYARAMKEFLTTKFDKLMTYKELFDSGYRMVFPKMYGNSKNITLVAVKYRGNDYNPVGIGEGNPYDYKYLIDDKPVLKDKDGNEVKNLINIDPKEVPEVNANSKAEYIKLVTDYLQHFGKALQDIFFNKNDAPKYGKDFEIAIDKINTSIGFYNIKPLKYASWDEYIAEKTKIRFTEFDLEENVAYHQEQQQQNQPPIVPPAPADFFPETTEPAKPINPNIENIAPLEPLLNPVNLTKDEFENDYKSMAAGYDSNPALLEQKSKKWFYFNNPINIRYNYQVTKIVPNGKKYIATVLITDKANSSTKRFYNHDLDFKKYSYSSGMSRYVIYEEFRRIFESIYGAFKLDEKLNYNEIPDQSLRIDLFNAVYLAIKTFELKEFENEYEKLANKVGNSNGYSNALENSNAVKVEEYNQYLRKHTKALVSRFLEARGIRTGRDVKEDKPRTFWEFLSKSLEYVINGEPFKTSKGDYRILKLRQYLEDKTWEPKFKTFFDLYKKNNIKISETFSDLQTRTVNLRKISNQFLVSIDDRIKMITDVYDGFYNHASLFRLVDEAGQYKVINDDNKDKKEEYDKKTLPILKDLQNRQDNIQKDNFARNTTYSVLALLTALFGSFLVIAMFIIMKKKNIKISKTIISIASIISIIALAAFISILLLMIGVL
ncbi:MSC_0620 family F1-like ATPase-associated subunit [Mycoplasma crocodyli]|uniref:Transmembrane protein n=1 Tax=Mycoplasma crocodyli (strain ATCC 51981 / MP145) TaxID=512564 RepID=D5E4T5_MYCCM|nr:hypothetical protein [Mycoplasma crocodyli]ADE19911.1 conserved hypothetical protein [Mycoplasma crocodyli MP145]